MNHPPIPATPMKRILLLSLLAAPLVSCSSTTPTTSTPAKPDAKPAKVAKGKIRKETTTATTKPKPYPLKTCLVSGEPLDSMDEEVSTVYQGQQFKFCCKPCLKKFEKNPDKYLKELAKVQ